MQPGKKGIEAVGYGDVEDIPAWTKGFIEATTDTKFLGSSGMK